MEAEDTSIEIKDPLIEEALGKVEKLREKVLAFEEAVDLGRLEPPLAADLETLDLAGAQPPVKRRTRGAQALDRLLHRQQPVGRFGHLALSGASRRFAFLRLPRSLGLPLRALAGRLLCHGSSLWPSRVSYHHTSYRR